MAVVVWVSCRKGNALTQQPDSGKAPWQINSNAISKILIKSGQQGCPGIEPIPRVFVKTKPNSKPELLQDSRLRPGKERVKEEANVYESKIKHESLILAQDERWRRA